jgi:type I restriction enzyme R subunit
MLSQNRTRMDFYEKFQKMIKEYNSGAQNVDAFFTQLVSFAKSLNDEEKRGISENLSEEELALFDILTRPGPTLTTEERGEVKKVARQLLERLNALLVLGWRQKAQARAGVRLAIEDGLDRERLVNVADL